MSVDDIKKLLGKEKLIIGTDRVLKKLKNSKIETVYVSKNCEPHLLSEIKHYAGMSKAKVENLEIPNDELGVVCKKPFSISVIGILR